MLIFVPVADAGGAGTLRYQNPESRFRAANSRRGFCHAQAPPERGTSPRATFTPPRPSWIPACAGLTILKCRNGHFRTNCRVFGALAGLLLDNCAAHSLHLRLGCELGSPSFASAL